MTDLFETKSKPVPITKQMVKDAYRKVKSNKGSAGIDQQSLEKYEEKLLDNLYVLWNRLSSGSYFPKPVREVEIPKTDGSKRKLGIPTVSDRIAQEVIKTYLEPKFEAIFNQNSYGYRPLRGAHDAIKQVQQNNKSYAWVIDMDIKAFFDEVNHELLMKCLDRHVEEKWVKMYIKRWLEAPSEAKDGTQTAKQGTGTPQGGVISPLLANLFLHYVLDQWLTKTHPSVAFVRYADDVIVHCYTEAQALQVLESIKERLAQCQLRLSEQKTKIVYCANFRNQAKNDYPKKYDFLGFTFKPKVMKSKSAGLFTGFTADISQKSQKRITASWANLDLLKSSELSLEKLSQRLNPQIRGIMQYYGKVNLHGLRKLFRRLQLRLCKWVRKKYKLRSYRKAHQWLSRMQESYPGIFYHWGYFEGF
jgi:RNA-directed DNA polymerase